MSSVEKADMTEEQVSAEESAQRADVYVHKFRKPFSWEGDTFVELIFIFGGLTAADMEDVEDEMAADNRYAIIPEYSTAYVMRLAAKAAKVHISLLEHLPLYDGNIIRRKARAFFMSGE